MATISRSSTSATPLKDVHGFPSLAESLAQIAAREHLTH